MMAAIAPIIRVFFSSTFTDFQAERNALQERVFPSVRRYCNERGARFLPIDLRWGISDEASQDQRIVRICLEEIRRCQAVSPYFNFVASLGDRYGTCLLPETIPQTDLDVLLASMNPGDRKMVLHYYKLDMNSIPAEYLLQPAPNHLPEWKQIALQLQAILVEASKSAPISQLMHLRLTASVTEQEIHAGIFQTTSSSHALCFIRTSSGTSIDPRQGEQHSTNQIQLADLKRRVEQKLPTGTVWYPATWENDELTSPSMDAFCELVEYHLCAKIEEALKKEDLEKKSSQWDLTSWNFVHDRLMYFTGRHTSLDTIRKYIASIIPIPLIITGPSGVGKTTLLLQAAKEAARSHPSSVHLYYFIGGNTTVATTPALLRDLFGQLLKAYPDLVPIDIPENPAALIMKINDFLALAGEDQPLILFIDALDQLQSTDTTSWLPSFLPPYVRLIVSLLPGTELHALRIQLPSDQMAVCQVLCKSSGSG